jgi:hypothetical protein
MIKWASSLQLSNADGSPELHECLTSCHDHVGLIKSTVQRADCSPVVHLRVTSRHDQVDLITSTVQTALAMLLMSSSQPRALASLLSDHATWTALQLLRPFAVVFLALFFRARCGKGRFFLDHGELVRES